MMHNSVNFTPVSNMSYQFEHLVCNYSRSRFLDPNSKCEQLPASHHLSLSFYADSHALLKKAIKAVIKEGAESGTSRVLPLQGIVDLNTSRIYLGALTPRDENAFVFNQSPLIEHKKKGLFDDGDYGSRMSSYQLFYSEGPTAHQQMLHYAMGRPVSVDDCVNVRGIALNIKMDDGQITIVIDGKSLSINQTAQYLRTSHIPGHKLNEHEADNSVLKASGKYSELCESWIYGKIEKACQHSIHKFSQDKPSFFSKATNMPVSGEHLTDEAMVEFYARLN